MEDVKVFSEELKKLGNQLFQSGDYVNAISNYNKALAINPQNSIIYFNRGISYFKQCLWQNALQDAISALNLDPSYQKAWLLKARAHREQGNYEDAETALHRLLSLCPHFRDAEELLLIVIENFFIK